MEATRTARLEDLRTKYAKHIGQALMKPNGPITPTPRATLQIGGRLRDHTIQQFPILPGAIQAYVDLASTREWTVSGKPSQVARTVEWINNAESINTHTGLVEYGYDALLKRHAQDYLIVGMMCMAASDDLGDEPAPLEYIDPVRLSFQRERRFFRRRGFVPKVRPEEKVWVYDGVREIRSRDLVHHYPYPLGANGFISPIMYLLPTATLAWLIRESDSAQIDGRKIRDIFLVSDPKISDAIEEGVLTLLALWQGESEQDVGIPIIPLSGLSSNQKVADLYARMGISDIPTTLNREEFTFAYVNEISAALGLALRHFWNNERTTNRALEIVQEQRQQQKGPSTFVRTQQRLMNRSGWLRRFGTGKQIPRFAFIEETDMSSMRDRAAAMKDIATALAAVNTSLGIYIKPESMIAWMQLEDLLPNEIELIAIQPDAIRTNPDENLPQDGEQTGQSDPDTTAQPTQDTPMDGTTLEKSLEYNEVVMNGDGQMIAQRHKIFPIARYLETEIKKEIEIYENADAGVLKEEELEQWLKQEVAEADTHNIRLVRSLASDPFLAQWIDVNKPKYEEGVFADAIHNCLNQVELNDDEKIIIDRIAIDWETKDDS